jgi:hypothetical protein
MKINLYYERVNNDQRLYYQIEMLFGIIRIQNNIQAFKVKEDENMSNHAKAKTVSLAEYMRLYVRYKDIKKSTIGLSSLLRYARNSFQCNRVEWLTYIGTYTAPLTAISAACIITLKSIIKLYIETHMTREQGRHRFDVIPAYQFTLFATRLEIEMYIHPFKSMIIAFRFLILLMKNPRSIKLWLRLIKTLRNINRSEDH